MRIAQKTYQKESLLKAIDDELENRSSINEKAKMLEADAMNRFAPQEQVVPEQQEQPNSEELAASGISSSTTNPNDQVGMGINYDIITPNILAQMILENYNIIKNRFDYINQPATPKNMLSFQLGGGMLTGVLHPMKKTTISKSNFANVPKAIRIAALQIGMSAAMKIAESCLLFENRSPSKELVESLSSLATRDYLLNKYYKKLILRSTLMIPPHPRPEGMVDSQSMKAFPVTHCYRSASLFEEIKAISNKAMNNIAMQNIILSAPKAVNKYLSKKDNILKYQLEKKKTLSTHFYKQLLMLLQKVMLKKQ